MSTLPRNRRLTALLFSVFFAHTAYPTDFTRCVDLLNIFAFYRLPEIGTSVNQETIRELVKAEYPELPPLVAVLRPKNAEDHNAAQLARLASLSGRLAPKSVSLDTAKAILDRTKANPVAAIENLEKYDTTGNVGFCFGRACAVTWTAKDDFGIGESALRKVFLIGDLWSPGSGRWRYHTSPAIAANDNAEGWWILDAALPEPMLPSRWVQYWGFEYGKEADETPLLFVTPTEQLVNDPRVKMEELLAHPKAGPYFRDLIRTFPRRRTNP